jgi:hypothetical protein
MDPKKDKNTGEKAKARKAARQKKQKRLRC